MPPAVEVWRPNHWTNREFLGFWINSNSFRLVDLSYVSALSFGWQYFSDGSVSNLFPVKFSLHTYELTSWILYMIFFIKYWKHSKVPHTHSGPLCYSIQAFQPQVPNTLRHSMVLHHESCDPEESIRCQSSESLKMGHISFSFLYLLQYLV